MTAMPLRRLRLALDALRGCEGRRVTAEELRNFYAERYVQLNPDVDVQDAPEKAEALLRVLRYARVERLTRVLEVGCGSGGVLEVIAGRLGAGLAVGVDYGLAQARQARDRVGASVILAQGERLPFRDREFELAYITDVLEHVIDPVALLRELGRVSEHVGFLVPLESGLLSSPLYAYRRVRGKVTNREQYGHIWRWFRPEVSALFRAAGLTIVWSRSSRPVSPPAFPSWRGRAVERLKAGTTAVSPLVSEALFGGVAMVGVARSRDVNASPP